MLFPIIGFHFSKASNTLTRAPRSQRTMSANGMDRPCSETHPEILGAGNRRSMNHGPQSDRASDDDRHRYR